MKKMKIILIAFFLLSFFVLLLNCCNEKKIVYNPGTYINSAEGYYSTVVLEVEVDKYQIIDIKIISHEEPPILADIVFRDLPPKIIKANSVDVDVITGATYTSEALLRAVEKALELAGEGVE